MVPFVLKDVLVRTRRSFFFSKIKGGIIRMVKGGIVLTLGLFLIGSICSYFKILGADYGDVQPIWTKLSDELTYLKDNKGRLHLFPIRMGNEGWAYCINPGILGPESGSYNARVEALEKAFANENTRKSLRTMVMEGFRLAEEKGCVNDFPKWYAVQMAISSYIKDGCQTTGSYRNSIASHSDTAVYYAYHNILDYVFQARKLIDYMKPNIELSYDEEGALSGGNQVFNVTYQTTNKQITFDVTLDGNVPTGTTLDKTQIMGEGVLKVEIPKDSLRVAGTFEVDFKTKSRVWDVFFLETSAGKQNTVTATNPMIEASNRVSLHYKPCDSKIKFSKQDEDTGQVLEGASFQFWGKNPFEHGFENNILGTFKMDSKGEIIVDGLLPSKTPVVYIRELEAPVGYAVLNNEAAMEIKIEDYNQVYKLVCNNKKKVPKIVKKDLTETAFFGEAEFEICNEDNSRASIFKEGGSIEDEALIIVSNEKGEVCLPTGLKFGTYRLIERKAPNGYLPNEAPYILK